MLVVLPTGREIAKFLWQKKPKNPKKNQQGEKANSPPKIEHGENQNPHPWAHLLLFRDDFSGLDRDLGK